MNNIEIEAIVEDYFERFYQPQESLGYSLRRDWLRTTLTTLTQKHEEEKAAVLKQIVDTFDESGNQDARNCVLFIARENGVDLSKTDVTKN